MDEIDEIEGKGFMVYMDTMIRNWGNGNRGQKQMEIRQNYNVGQGPQQKMLVVEKPIY